MSFAVALFNRLGLFGRAQDDIFESRLAALSLRQQRVSLRYRPSPFKYSSRQIV